MSIALAMPAVARQQEGDTLAVALEDVVTGLAATLGGEEDLLASEDVTGATGVKGRLVWLQRLLYRPTDSETAITTHLRHYARLSLATGPHLGFNLTLEQDPGEVFRWQPSRRQYGFDYVSAHASVSGWGPFHRIVLGDFDLRYGPGLTLWRGTAFFKGATLPRTPFHPGAGVVPYRGADESRFFRGVAFSSAPYRGFSLLGFYSHRHRDARAADTLSVPVTFSALEETGYHRTPLERWRRQRLAERIYGGGITFQRASVSGGVLGYVLRYGTPIAPGNSPADHYAFSGRSAALLGFHLKAHQDNIDVAAETALGADGKVGTLLALRWQDAARVRVVLQARWLPLGFHSPMGNPMRAQTRGVGPERGLYLGMSLPLHPHWRLLAYVDHYRNPWLLATRPRPSLGQDALGRLTYAPRRWLKAYLQGVLRMVEERSPLRDGVVPQVASLSRAKTAHLHLDLRYHFSERVTLHTRLSRSWHRAPPLAPEEGVLIFQDVTYHATSALRLDARFTYFHTDGFATRIYTYEDDLPHTFSVPSFSGMGQRGYLLLTLTPRSGLTLSLKYAVTRRQQDPSNWVPWPTEQRHREVRLQFQYRP